MNFTQLKKLTDKYKGENMDAFLTQLVECVENYTEESIESIRQEICKSKNSHEKFGKIYTIVSAEMDEKVMKNKGWYAPDASCCVQEINSVC